MQARRTAAIIESAKILGIKQFKQKTRAASAGSKTLDYSPVLENRFCIFKVQSGAATYQRTSTEADDSLQFKRLY